MYAVEFKTKIKNGVIEVPKRFRNSITDSVKVIILKDDAPPQADAAGEVDMVSRLLADPVTIKDFHPLTRDEIHAR